MRRRTFLALPGGLVAAGLAARLSCARAADARTPWWQPAPDPTLTRIVALEWRYLAGRITSGNQDFGFVVSISDYNPPLADRKELLVMRQDFTGSQSHVTKTYAGTLPYNSATATYAFTDENGAATASWRYDETTARYYLSIASPELSLTDLELIPQGPLLAEGGDGAIDLGVVRQVKVASDYYADWVEIRAGGQQVGRGRLDMQTVRPELKTPGPEEPEESSFHYWFAVAAEQDGVPVWLSASRIQTPTTLNWLATVVRGTGAGWSVASYTEASPVAYPLTVDTLAWQPMPAPNTPARETGTRWRFRLGATQPGDLLDVELAVPAGQFINNSRTSAFSTQSQMQEAIGLACSGTLGGRALGATAFVVAESTAERTLVSEPKLHLPALLR